MQSNLNSVSCMSFWEQYRRAYHQISAATSAGQWETLEREGKSKWQEVELVYVKKCRVTEN